LSGFVAPCALPPWQELPLKQQIAQLLVVRASGHLFDHERRYPQWETPTAELQHWIQDLGIGGVILLGGSTAELMTRIQQMQAWSRVPLLMAADIEQGVGQRFSGATWMPPPMALGAIAQSNLSQACAYARAMGAITAQEAEAVGLNWLLAPLVDVNNNPDNPAISLRAFGETPEIVIPLATAFIQGAQNYRVLTTAKHFPGHGDTSVDPHLDLPIIPHDRHHLDQTELAPFRAAIATGVNAVMTAHLKVPALDPEYPATFSSAILTQLLRQEMGFGGLIVTDALVMQAITRHYGAEEAAILALAAGADILLMPVDPHRTIAAIDQAIQTGRLSQARVHAALERIWQAKQYLFNPVPDSELLSPELLSPELLSPELPSPELPSPELPSHQSSQTSSQFSSAWIEQIAQPAALDLCHLILEQSLTVQTPSLPAQTSSPPCSSTPLPANSITASGSMAGTIPVNLIVVDNLLQANFLGLHTPAIKTPQAWGYRLQWIDSQAPSMTPILPFQPTLLQLFIQANPFQDTTGLVQIARCWLEALLAAGQLQALILYGSPYVWQQLLPLLPAEIPAVFSYGQIPMAQMIALEKLSAWGWGMPTSALTNPQFTT
jgi:beta-glucosidase